MQQSGRGPAIRSVRRSASELPRPWQTGEPRNRGMRRWPGLQRRYSARRSGVDAVVTDTLRRVTDTPRSGEHESAGLAAVVQAALGECRPWAHERRIGERRPGYPDRGTDRLAECRSKARAGESGIAQAGGRRTGRGLQALRRRLCDCHRERADRVRYAEKHAWRRRRNRRTSVRLQAPSMHRGRRTAVFHPWSRRPAPRDVLRADSQPEPRGRTAVPCPFLPELR